MTKRQLEVLRMVRAKIEKGEAWIDLGLSKGAESLITWDELQWVVEFEKQAMLTRIDAALLVDDAVTAMRLPGFSNEGAEVEPVTCEPRCVR